MEKASVDDEDIAAGFANAKERAEFFKKLQKTHIPVEEIGLPNPVGKG